MDEKLDEKKLIDLSDVVRKIFSFLAFVFALNVLSYVSEIFYVIHYFNDPKTHMGMLFLAHILRTLATLNIVYFIGKIAVKVIVAAVPRFDESYLGFLILPIACLVAALVPVKGIRIKQHDELLPNAQALYYEAKDMYESPEEITASGVFMENDDSGEDEGDILLDGYFIYNLRGEYYNVPVDEKFSTLAKLGGIGWTDCIVFTVYPNTGIPYDFAEPPVGSNFDIVDYAEFTEYYGKPYKLYVNGTTVYYTAAEPYTKQMLENKKVLEPSQFLVYKQGQSDPIMGIGAKSGCMPLPTLDGKYSVVLKNNTYDDLSNVIEYEAVNGKINILNEDGGADLNAGG